MYVVGYNTILSAFLTVLVKLKTIDLGKKLANWFKDQFVAYCLSGLQAKNGFVCKVAKLCPTLCNPTDYSPPGSSVRGILQARILECTACPPPRDLPDPGIEPMSLTSPALAGRFFTSSATWEAQEWL